MLLGIHAIPPSSEVTHMEEVVRYLKIRRTKGTEHGRTRNKTYAGSSMSITTHCAYQRQKNEKSSNSFRTSRFSRQKPPKKVMEKLAGSLHHALLVIPGGADLFSPIQVALKVTSQWLRVTPDLKIILQDWGAIIKHMGRHTTQVRHLVKNLPHYIGYSYSCGIGTGGVCTSGLNKIGPIILQE